MVLRILSPIKDNNQRYVFCDGCYSSISLMEKLGKKNYLNVTMLRNSPKNLTFKNKRRE